MASDDILHKPLRRDYVFLKAFIGALFLTFRNLVNFNYSQRQGNDRCLWCVFMHLVTIWDFPTLLTVVCYA